MLFFLGLYDPLFSFLTDQFSKIKHLSCKGLFKVYPPEDRRIMQEFKCNVKLYFYFFLCSFYLFDFSDYFFHLSLSFSGFEELTTGRNRQYPWF